MSKKKKNHETINYKYHKYIQNNNNNIKLLNFWFSECECECECEMEKRIKFWTSDVVFNQNEAVFNVKLECILVWFCAVFLL